MDRQSYTRLVGDRPVSSAIGHVACDADFLAYEVEGGGLTHQEIAERIQRLARRLEALESSARSIESVAKDAMGRVAR